MSACGVLRAIALQRQCLSGPLLTPPAAYWMAANPDAVIFPALPDGSPDPALRLETHSYDPWGFCGALPPSQDTWGSPEDVETVDAM